MKRYYAYKFTLNNPILIDTKEKTVTFFNTNIYAQIYNLEEKPKKYSHQKINGLIRRMNGGNYYKNSFVIDSYIYNYFMTDEQKARCNRSIDVNDKEFIASGDSKKEVLTEVCKRTLEYNTKRECDRGYYINTIERMTE